MRVGEYPTNGTRVWSIRPGPGHEGTRGLRTGRNKDGSAPRGQSGPYYPIRYQETQPKAGGGGGGRPPLHGEVEASVLFLCVLPHGAVPFSPAHFPR